MTIVVATTLHAYVTGDPDTSQAWLYNAEAIADSYPDHVQFFAALELDGRGLEPFQPLLDRLRMLRNHDFWTFSFDDHATEITAHNRVRRITMGQNMCNDYAMSVGASHMLFCAADCAPPPDVLPKLLEMNHPLCGPDIPTYCLSGPEPMVHSEECRCEGTGRMGAGLPGFSEPCWDGEDEVIVPRFPNFPVQEHMASAACVLLARDVFRQIRWRADGDAGMSDDPCLHHDALTHLGIPTYVRKDIQARHYPEVISSIEDRQPDTRKIVLPAN